MLTDLQLARDVYANIYLDTIPPGAFDKIIQGPINDIFVGIKIWPNEVDVCARGSMTIPDWVGNGFAVPVQDEKLGPVHQGFRDSVQEIKSELDAFLAQYEAHKAIRCQGHSRGAAQAVDIAGYRATEGKPLCDVVAWGVPRTGCAKLASILDPYPVRLKINGDGSGHDYVTDVPFRIPPEFPYMQARPLIPVSASPAPDDEWGFLRYHHFALYIEGESNPPPIIKFGRLNSEDFDQ